MDKKCNLNAPELNSGTPPPLKKRIKRNRDCVSLTKYSGTKEIKQQIKLSVDLSLHAGSLIDAEKIVHVAKGRYRAAIGNLPGFRSI